MKKEVTRKNFYPSRDRYILEHVTGKKVLHIGPTDWPYTERKIKQDGLLYKKIDELCEQQIGIDFDKEGVDFLNTQDFPHSQIIEADMNYIDELDLDFTPDVIIFGETMEHLMNQEVALSGLKKVMTPETDLIISVPNATHLVQIGYALFGTEYQHPDHSAAFSYKVMKQLLEKNDFVIQEFLFTFLSPQDNDFNWKGKFVYYIMQPIARLFPLLSSNLLVRVRCSK